jgi:putative ABC transport system permease protein
MIPFFSARLAAREGRAGFRRIGVFMGAIALGVGALTGLHAFQQDAADGVRAEARELLGGDLRLQSGAPFSDSVTTILAGLEERGFQVAEAVTLATSVAAPGGSRFLQLNAVADAYPLLGMPPSEPEGAWLRLREERAVVADARVLAQLGVAPGDSLRLGAVRVVVAGAVTGLPVDLGPQSIVGPPLFASRATLDAAGLLGFGSLAQYRVFLLAPASVDPDAEARALRRELRGERIQVQSARAQAEELAEGFRGLSRFLGLVGLMALLLGGIGVASAVHVYVRERIPAIAVLRCLGAREGTVFRAYLLQALVLGAGGAAVGVLLGVGIQFGLPLALAGVLPFDPSPRLRLGTMAAGLGVGAWVALLFALLPLLSVREVPPLAALRSEVDPRAMRRILPRILAGLALVATLFLLSVAQVGGVVPGLVFAASLGVVLAILGGISRLLAAGARRFLPARAPFSLRQGVSGLFRPGNQTGAVLVALGFGAFLVGALLVAEAGLRASLSFASLEASGGGEPSLVLLDVQEDQLEAVTSVLEASGARGEFIPLVPARLSTVAGVSVDAMVADGSLPGWVARRVYRNSWRERPSSTERVVAGSWDAAGDAEAVRAAVADGALRVSMEAEIAGELGVRVGDRVEWDIQGRIVPSVVSSLREVEWASLRPNFYAVFEPGALEGAPVTWVGLVPGLAPAEVDGVQEALLDRVPNVSVLDVSAIRATVERVSGRVVQVLRALAAFATAGGFLVLFAALLTGRFRRRKESALLKTLGARAPVVRGALLWEYAVLGAVGATAGLLLGAGGGVVLLAQVFSVGALVPWGTLLATWTGLVALTVGAGWSTSGPVLREPPLVVLREGG